MAASFPTSLPAAVTFDDNDTPGGIDLPEFLNQNRDELRALGSKLGTGASTPVTTSALRGTGTGTSAWTVTPKVHVYNSSNQSIGDSSFTAITLNSERHDANAMHSTGSNTDRLTAVVAGEYLGFANVQFASNATGFRALEVVHSTRGTIASQWAPAVNGNVTVLNLVFQCTLAVGEYVYMQVYQNSTGALDVVAQPAYSPEFGCVWVGP